MTLSSPIRLVTSRSFPRLTSWRATCRVSVLYRPSSMQMETLSCEPTPLRATRNRWLSLRWKWRKNSRRNMRCVRDADAGKRISRMSMGRQSMQPSSMPVWLARMQLWRSSVFSRVREETALIIQTWVRRHTRCWTIRWPSVRNP